MDLPTLQKTCHQVCELITQVAEGIAKENLVDLTHEISRLQQAGQELTKFLDITVDHNNDGVMKTFRHDLRNIFSAITGYGEIIKEDSDDTSALSPPIKEMLNLTKSALRLIEAPKSENVIETAFSFDNSTNSKIEVNPVESGKLLVIDDNENNRDLLSHHLKNLGHQVTAVDSAKNASLAMQDTEFDLILLDLIMPDIDGYQFLKQLKASDQWRAIPIIMVSGIDDTDGVIQCIKAGAEDYLTKPFNAVLLEARLSSCLEKKRWHDRELSILNELEKRNHFIRQTFGRYLTDEIVSNLLENPDGLNLGGGYKKVTIIMTDIRSFTTHCEQLTPDRVVKLLNNYLGVMTQVIMDFKGTVDEFIGDAILALFGAPIEREDDTDRAIACAIAMQLAMDEVNDKNSRDGLPTISMGIGINTGEVIAGNIGSDQRLKYAVVGQHVNLAARVESHTSGGQILASQNTIDAATTPLIIGKSQTVNLKGFREAVSIHDILGIDGSFNLKL